MWGKQNERNRGRKGRWGPFDLREVRHLGGVEALFRKRTQNRRQGDAEIIKTRESKSSLQVTKKTGNRNRRLNGGEGGEGKAENAHNNRCRGKGEAHLKGKV